MSEKIRLSQIDEDRFGIRTARADITSETLSEALDFCNINNVRMLIARVPVTDLLAAQELERQGAQLMDTLMYYTRPIGLSQTSLDNDKITVRPIGLKDADAVRQVAAHSFQDYIGHYHADPRLDRTKCDEAYSDWAYRSCVDKSAADDVLVAVDEGEIIGFATLRINTPVEGEGVLFGVHPKARRKGVFTGLILEMLEWGLNQNLTRILYSTQLSNIPVQRALVRQGFDLDYAFYTFHRWGD